MRNVIISDETFEFLLDHNVFLFVVDNVEEQIDAAKTALAAARADRESLKYHRALRDLADKF